MASTVAVLPWAAAKHNSPPSFLTLCRQVTMLPIPELSIISSLLSSNTQRAGACRSSHAVNCATSPLEFVLVKVPLSCTKLIPCRTSMFMPIMHLVVKINGLAHGLAITKKCSKINA